jgi:hypothetical protein
MRRAQQQTITFPAYDSTVSTGALLAGLTFLASDVKVSKDGAVAVDATNAPVEITGMPGMYALTLTAAELECSWPTVLVTKAGMRPCPLYGGMDAQRTAAVAGTGQTTTSFATDLTETTTDAHKGKLARFQSGALAGQVRKITAYNGTTKALTFTDAFSAAPSAGDVFALIDD